ncbi:flagellar hook-basal body complex protein FliE [Rhizobiaceae bacterium BDR2-2]|uniref:Flagellar hook-basal body complex protein FliE n=1 Tax=Ectorhizobium quercum TaxID=2965071 RepID=A0AAE3MXH7_9HYPH|nr:flagellar hook-basal body complex protein FliE [Ectorhizobium quercum]MCX8996102.1 flagellar hook-basal body complex protein FliE [Ectorhizobium quercum]
MIDTIQATSSLLTKGIGTTTGSKTENSLMGNAVTAAASTVVGPTFGAVLGNMANEAITSVKNGEGAAFAGIQGTASTREVVDAMLQADQSLKTAIAVRDKVVQAYLEITKMQI